MSWLRSAVNRAMMASGDNTITRTVRSYADTVVQHAGQAVAGGAKIIQDRMGVRNYQSFKMTLKSLEETAVSSRGLERIQLLRRWLIAFQEVEKMTTVLTGGRHFEQEKAIDDSKPFLRGDSIALYFDSDLGGEPMNFRTVFLYSQALEGITLSMILEPPNEEEISLLLEIFGLCLSGGKEVHNAIMSSIQDLGRSFSGYEDEVLAKRDELLQFARAAITGLKLSPDAARIDAEASPLREKVDGLVELLMSSDTCPSKKSKKATVATIEAIKESLIEVRLCSRLKALMLEKKSIQNGDSFYVHSQKVDKLKVLAESLASSSTKAEKRILEHRHQKEEAIDYRVAKAKEVTDIEKELVVEIDGLEKQKDELEAQLRKVNVSLRATKARLRKTREERDQFNEASNQMLLHLKSKEEDLSKSAASCAAEAAVVHTWITFLEDTWLLQSSLMEQKHKQINDDVDKYGKYLVKMIKHHVTLCKDELGPSINRIRTFGYNLKNFRRSESMLSASRPSLAEPNQRKLLEEEYLDAEAKIITSFIVIDNMKELLNAERGITYREDCSEVDKILEDIERMRGEFESLERPRLDLENPPEKDEPTVNEKPQNGSGASQVKKVLLREKSKKSPVITTDVHMAPEAALAKLESDYGSPNTESAPEDIAGWEFDEF